jgi:hypothetical protein
MKYAATGTKEFSDDDGDGIVVRAEPTGSQYDERQNLLGNMKFPGSTISDNTNMEDLFSGGEMVEVSVDKKALSEFQLRAIVISLTMGGRSFSKWQDIVGVYRKLDKASKDQIDKWIDSVWKEHEKDVAALEKSEGESDASLASSSVGDA